MSGESNSPNGGKPRLFASRSFLIYAIAVVIVAAGAALLWRTMPKRRSVFTDAQSIRIPVDTAFPRDVLWSAPQAPDPIELQAGDSEPALSTDGLSFFFVRPSQAGDSEIWRADRTREGWQTPKKLTEVNSKWDDKGPAPSADGNTLYFYSDRSGGLGGFDLWVSHRDPKTGEFGQPQNLGANINTRDNEICPADAPNGGGLYFASDRPHSSDSPEPDAARDFDVYITRNIYGERFSVEAMDAINSSFDEVAPSISPVGDFVYFASNRIGGRGGLDLYRYRLSGAPDAVASRLDDTINTQRDDTDPWPAQMGYALYYRTNAAHRNDNDDTAAQSDSVSGAPRIMVSFSREVFRASSIEQASLDWKTIGAVIALAITALLLLLMARIMTDAVLRRRLSLLARCMLVSLAFHLALIFLLSLWHVTSSLAGWSPDPGSIQVSLASAAGGGGLMQQVRGTLTSSPAVKIQATTVQSPQSVQPTTPRLASQIEPVLQRSEATSLQPVPLTQNRQIAPSQPKVESARQASRRIAATASLRSPAKIATPRASAPTAQREPVRQFASAVLQHQLPAPPKIDVTSRQKSSSPEPTQPTTNHASLPSGTLTLTHSTPDMPPINGASKMTSTKRQALRPIIKPTAIQTSLRLPTMQSKPNSSPSKSGDELALQPAAPKTTSEPAEIEPLSANVSPTRNLEPSLRRHAGSSSHILDTAPASIRSPNLQPIKTNTADPQNTNRTLSASRSPATNQLPSPKLTLRLPTTVNTDGDAPLGPGWITGSVIDAETRIAIAGATVRLDRSGRDDTQVRTDPAGRYALEVSDVPEHFALSASADGYLPASINIPARDVIKRTLWIDFELPPEAADALAIEAAPDVHHLGDDRFNGVINSRFQKRSEGAEFKATFTLSTTQIAPHYQTCELTLMARGVQLSHPIYINGKRLRTRLDSSPRDGRFGEFRANIPMSYLTEGENSLRIRSTKRGADRDDFEFVNVQLHLSH